MDPALPITSNTLGYSSESSKNFRSVYTETTAQNGPKSKYHLPDMGATAKYE